MRIGATRGARGSACGIGGRGKVSLNATCTLSVIGKPNPPVLMIALPVALLVPFVAGGVSSLAEILFAPPSIIACAT